LRQRFPFSEKRRFAFARQSHRIDSFPSAEAPARKVMPIKMKGFNRATPGSDLQAQGIGKERLDKIPVPIDPDYMRRERRTPALLNRPIALYRNKRLEGILFSVQQQKHILVSRLDKGLVGQ
jgi:hypothetical protein